MRWKVHLTLELHLIFTTSRNQVLIVKGHPHFKIPREDTLLPFVRALQTSFLIWLQGKEEEYLEGVAWQMICDTEII